MKKTFLLSLTIILLMGCQRQPEKPTPVGTAALTPTINTTITATPRSTFTPLPPLIHKTPTLPPLPPPRLELADYPPSPAPYRIEDGDFWLVHTPDGQLMAFIPIAPTYAPHVTIDECRYSWTPANQRFEDPCSGDKWELNGQLNVAASSELWSNRDLDQYGLTVTDGSIFVQTHQIIEGVAIDHTLLAQDEQYGVRLVVDSTNFSPAATTINLLAFIDPIWQVNPNIVPPQQALIHPTFPNSLVDDQGRKIAPRHSSIVGRVFDSASGGVQQRSQVTWEGIADDANSLVASFSVTLDNIRDAETFPLAWLDRQAGDTWDTDTLLQFGYANIKIAQVEWVDTVADGSARLRLTVTDANPAAFRLYCFELDTAPPAQSSSCPNFEREAKFEIVTEPNKPVTVHLLASLEIRPIFRLHIPLETAVSANCPIDQIATSPTTSPITTSPLTIVYTAPDGIYRWQESTGQSDLILATQAEIMGVQLSDDGQRIAFVQVVDPQAKRLALGVFDIAKAAAEQPLIFLTPDALHGLLNATPLEVVQPLQVTWVPNSHQIAFSTIRRNLINGVLEGLSSQFSDDLHLFDSDTGAVHTLVPAGEGGNFTYAPNGQHIALVADNSLSLIDSNGENYFPHILRWPKLGLGHQYHRPEAAWLPDSNSLLIAISNAADNIDAAYNPDASSTIWRVSSVDRQPRQVTTMVGAPIWLSYSPDRSQVGFVRDGGESSTDDLHIAAIDNVWNEVYAMGQGLDIAAWLPDSSGFLYRSFRENPQIGRLCHPPNPLLLPHTPDSFVRFIEWIDTKRFVFTIDTPPQLFLGNLDGNFTLVGSLRNDYFFNVGSLQAFDFKY